MLTVCEFGRLAKSCNPPAWKVIKNSRVMAVFVLPPPLVWRFVQSYSGPPHRHYGFPTEVYYLIGQDIRRVCGLSSFTNLLLQYRALVL